MVKQVLLAVSALHFCLLDIVVPAAKTDDYERCRKIEVLLFYVLQRARSMVFFDSFRFYAYIVTNCLPAQLSFQNFYFTGSSL